MYSRQATSSVLDAVVAAVVSLRGSRTRRRHVFYKRVVCASVCVVPSAVSLQVTAVSCVCVCVCVLSLIHI